MLREITMHENAGIESQAQAYANELDCNLKQASSVPMEPTLRDRLEAKRNRLSRELVQVEEALRLVYADPNVERIHETLKRARV